MQLCAASQLSFLLYQLSYQQFCTSAYLDWSNNWKLHKHNESSLLGKQKIDNNAQQLEYIQNMKWSNARLTYQNPSTSLIPEAIKLSQLLLDSK